MRGIPAITHQTAASSALSSEQAMLRGRMIAQNPGWDHRFYTDADCRDLIRRAFPGLLATYDAYPTAIQRTDLFRVAAVYMHGGVYLDLDMDCLVPLAPLAPHACVLAEEKTLSPQQAAISATPSACALPITCSLREQVTRSGLICWKPWSSAPRVLFCRTTTFSRAPDRGC